MKDRLLTDRRLQTDRRPSTAPRLPTARQLDQILSFLKERLSPHRVLHSVGTAHEALQLAALWGCDPEEALVAGLLHDCAKEEDPSIQRRRINGNGDWADPEDEGFPAIWHAVASAALAAEEFGISPEAARAIRLHPTGDAEMTLLDQVVFLADYLEPMRKWEGAEELRRLARRDLAAAVREAVFQKISHVKSKGKMLHPRALRALEALKKGGPCI